MLNDGNQAIGTDGSIDLDSYGVFSGAPELLDFEVLLEPFEEQLYLPTVLVEFCDLQRSQFHGIGKEHELTALLLIIEPYESQMLRISFLAAVDSQRYLCISQYSFGHPALPPDILVLQVRLGPNNEERLRMVYAVELLEVVVATVEDVVST